MTDQRDIPHFQGWKNVEDGYHTKTRLRQEFGLKPVDESNHDATARLVVNGKWGDFVLYHIDHCVEIKKRKVKEVPITNKSIAEALYVINKSAKVSRDTKQHNYFAGNHAIVKAAKTRQKRLYDLKNNVIQKLMGQQKLTVKGYHIMGGRPFLLLELEGFSFHMPTDQKDHLHNLPHLGELEEKISAEKTISVSINFFEAENILKRFAEHPH